MYVILLACTDLMTSSRLEVDGSVDVRRCSSVQRLMELIEQEPDAAVVIDLTAFEDLPEVLAAGNAPTPAVTIAFAPHVREDLMAKAAPYVDLVVPRGAALRSISKQVSRAREAKGCTSPPDMA